MKTTIRGNYSFRKTSKRKGTNALAFIGLILILFLLIAGTQYFAWINPKDGQQYYLRHNGKEHVIALAPTRSGKGVGLVIPTLLSWEHSVVVLDIKGENWALTSGWRHENGHKVLRWDPTDAIEGRSARYNPLAGIRIGTVYETAKYLSDRLGVTTVIKEQESISYQGGTGIFAKKSVTKSQQEVQRAVLTPDEIMRLPGPVKDVEQNITEPGDMLVFAAGFPPVYGKQILYFLDKTFSERSKIDAPEESDRL